MMYFVSLRHKLKLLCPVNNTGILSAIYCRDGAYVPLPRIQQQAVLCCLFALSDLLVNYIVIDCVGI